MEGLGVAASVIAVVDLSVKIASLCVQYSLAVKHAKADVERLGGEVNSITDLLRGVERLLQRPDNTQLLTSQKLRNALEDCFSQLTQLNTTLNPRTTRKIMSRLGVRALKWPFESKAVEKVISDLERCKQTISLALQVDQTALILGIHQKIDLAKLPSAKGAAFDSHLDEHDARCLPNTRVDLRRDIAEWAEDRQGKCMFWLNGMAGTGKSTISRTVAQSFSDKGQLGGSFFFKRGEGDRGNATRFFTTIAAQMTTKVPGLSPFIGNAIDADPAISEKTLKDQFEKLILQPFSRIQSAASQASRVVIVVDALDECEREEDIKTILHLLSQFRNVTSVCLRVFITSRPELPIRLGFKNIKEDVYQNLVLHEISPATIEHDILTFLQHELINIRLNRSITMDWPGQENIQALVRMAVPLFIFAATVCRFIGDPRWDPKKRLATILEYQTKRHASKFDKTYLPILDQLLIGQDEVEKDKLAREFREVVGAIVVLTEPLSIISLASLLEIPEEDVTYRLDLLHSVLNIPTNQAHPVRLLHLSFRNFLLDDQTPKKTPLWVNERQTHKMIASKCLHLMSKCLKKDICNLRSPGTLKSEIDRQIINLFLPAEVQYACRHWVYHLQCSTSSIYNEDQVHIFLQKHLLHWLEALSLLGNTALGIIMITTLLSNLDANKSPDLYAFIYDAKRFTLYNRSVIEQAPLQLYCSALIFAPENSIVRQQFKEDMPSWIQRKPTVQANWNAMLQTLEGHLGWVTSVAFSPDGKQIISGSSDQTVRLWDATTGAALQTFKGHSDSVTSVAFSPDGKQIISSSSDRTVRLWDAIIGAALQTLKGHSDSVTSVAFSSDGKQIISGSSDRTVWLWDATIRAALQTLKGHSGWVTSVAFSPDGKQIISGSSDQTVRLWDATTGAALQTFKGHSDSVTSVAFSPDGKQIISSSSDRTVRLWDAIIGAALQTLKGHSGWVTSVAFSPDGKQIISGSDDQTVRLWDATTGAALQTLKGHSGWVTSVAFSPDGKQIISSSSDRTVRLWDAIIEAALQTLKGHSGWVTSVAFSPDGKQIISGSRDRTVRLWDATTGAALQTLKGHSGWVTSVAFSPDGKQIISGSSDRTVRLWDATTGAALQTLKGHSGRVTSVVFSPDGKQIISGSDDRTVRLWDATIGAALQTLKGHSDSVTSVAFSPDGKQIISGSRDQTVRLWDATIGAALQTLKGHSGWVTSVAFSPDGKQIISGSSDRTVRLWDATTGAALQTLKGHSDRVSSVAFSPDSKLLPTLHIWNYWLVEGTTNILWLPSDYRSTCEAIWDETIILGHSSGRISFLQIQQGPKLII